MSFSSEEFFVDYMTKGFYRFNAKSLLSKVKITPFELLDKITPTGVVPEGGFEYIGNPDHVVVQRLKKEISERFLVDFNHELLFDVFSYHTCDDVRRWHNDAELAMKGQNASINCFFDDTNEEVGGVFQMQPYSENPDGEYFGISSVYPKKYDIIILNQNRNYLHRVGYSAHVRRLVSFACRFVDFNPILENPAL